jgi:hypothetical protein
MRIKETLLQNLTKMGVNTDLPNFIALDNENDQPLLSGSDPLDVMLH